MQKLGIVVIFTLSLIVDYVYGACGNVPDQDCPSKLILSLVLRAGHVQWMISRNSSNSVSLCLTRSEDLYL